MQSDGCIAQTTPRRPPPVFCRNITFLEREASAAIRCREGVHVFGAVKRYKNHVFSVKILVGMVVAQMQPRLILPNTLWLENWP